jgi:hypothetical protein
MRIARLLLRSLVIVAIPALGVTHDITGTAPILGTTMTLLAGAGWGLTLRRGIR